MKKGSKHTEETRIKMVKNSGTKGKIPWNKGMKMLDKYRAKLSNAHFGKKRCPHTLETKTKISIAHIGKPKLYSRGENNCNWKGGITPINQIIRHSLEYKLWRKAVFERDNYICIWCGARSGNGKAVVLHADHIKPFAYFPELRFAIDNGRTLCMECHKKTYTYGNHKFDYKNIENVEEIVKN